MLNRTDLKELQERLEKRRKDIFQNRLGIDAAWKDLQAPEPEAEAMAQKQGMALGLDRLDSKDKEEIEAIDMALRRIAAGTYGTCPCGRDIEIKRLKAIPWTPKCIRCATGREPDKFSPSDDRAYGSDVSRFANLSDDDLQEAIWDEIHDDDRLDIDELEITCDDGSVILEGSVPSHRQHSLLMEILEEVMGLEDIVDNLRIEHLSWEKHERSAGYDDEDEEDIVLNESEEEGGEGWESSDDLSNDKDD